MKVTINADNDEHDYEIMFTDESVDHPNFVEMVVKQKGEDYYETWVLSVKDLYDAVNLFDNRRIS